MKQLQAIFSVLVMVAAASAALVPPALAYGGSPALDSDNDFQSANTITSGTPASGDVSRSDDRSDYYKITDVLAGQTIKVSYTYANASAGINLYLCTSWGAQLFGITGGSGTTRGNTWLAPYNGTYYIQVRADNGVSTYTLTVTLGTPTELVPGNAYTGNLNSGTDARSDWYRIWLKGNESGWTEVGWIDMVSKSNSNAAVGRMFYDNLNYVGIHPYNESGTGTNNRDNISAAASYWGWYYYRIYCTGQSSDYRITCGKYTVSPSDANNDCLNGTVVPMNTNMTGRTEKAFDHYDWYAYKVKKNDNIMVNTQRQNSCIFNVSIFSSNLTYILGGDNSARDWWGRHDAWVNLTTTSVLADDTYYVGVSGESAYDYWGNPTDGYIGLDYKTSFFTPNHLPELKLPINEIVVNEDEKFRLNIYDHFNDPDGDRLTAKVNAAHILGSYCATSGDLDVYGTANWFGSDRATIVMDDGRGGTNQALVNVTVLSVDDPPAILKPLPDVNMPQGGQDTSLNLSKHFYDNDTAPNGNDRLNYSVSDNGSIRVNITADGKVTLTGLAIFWGLLNMTFTATDTTGLAASAVCRVNVYHVNQPPLVKDSYPPLDFEVNEDDSITRDFSAVFWDPDGDPITITASGNSRISVTQAPGTLNLTFTPNPDASDFIEHIKLTAQDDKGLGSNFVFSNVRVIPVNDAPRITSFSPSADITITETDSFTFNVSATDPENGEAINYTWRLDEETVLMGMTSFTYRTDYSSAGIHVVKVEIDDGELTAGRVWNVTVRNLNRPPADLIIVSPKPGETFKHGASITFNGSATDPDGDVLDYRWLEGNPIGRGQICETVLSDGPHKIVLEVSDGTTAVKTGPLSITVKVNTAPKIIYSTPSKGQRFEKGQEILFSVDVKNDDNDTLSYCWTEGGRELSNQPGFALSSLSPGTHLIHLTVSDGLGGMDYLDIEVVVSEPAAAGQNYLLLGGAAVGIILLVAAVAAALIIRKKKEPPLATVVQEAPPPENW